MYKIVNYYHFISTFYLIITHFSNKQEAKNITRIFVRFLKMKGFELYWFDCTTTSATTSRASSIYLIITFACNIKVSLTTLATDDVLTLLKPLIGITSYHHLTT